MKFRFTFELDQKTINDSFLSALVESTEYKNTDDVVDVPINIDTKIFSYIFGHTDDIDYERITEYFNAVSFMNMRVDDLCKSIKQFVGPRYSGDIVHNRSTSVFTQLLLLHQRNTKLFDINDLFVVTGNIEEIFNSLKNTDVYLVDRYYDNFDTKKFENDSKLLDVFKYNMLHPELCVKSRQQFDERFKALTCNLFDEELEWNNMVIAGGVVLESLHLEDLNKNTDVDIFLYGDQDEQKQKTIQLLEYFTNKNKKFTEGEVSCLSCDTGASKKAWFGQFQSIVFVCFQDVQRTIQIIRTSNLTRGDVISEFDMYFCSVLFDGKDVLAIREFGKSINNTLGKLTRKSFDCTANTSTKVRKTLINPSCKLKPKRIFKAINKGFYVHLDSDVLDEYNKYVDSGEGIVDQNRLYYPTSSVSDDVNRTMLSCMYRTSTFVLDSSKLDLDSITSFGYKENEQKDDIVIGEQKTIVVENDKLRILPLSCGRKDITVQSTMNRGISFFINENDNGDRIACIGIKDKVVKDKLRELVENILYKLDRDESKNYITRYGSKNGESTMSRFKSNINRKFKKIDEDGLVHVNLSRSASIFLDGVRVDKEMFLKKFIEQRPNVKVTYSIPYILLNYDTIPIKCIKIEATMKQGEQ